LHPAGGVGQSGPAARAFFDVGRTGGVTGRSLIVPTTFFGQPHASRLITALYIGL
jgi:hypothetical protein